VSLRLYLDNTATASPFPTTSKKLVTSAPASEVQLGPGEFDAGIPGAADAGQWNPSSPLTDTTLSAEIDNTGTSLGTTRQGWLYDVALTGRRLPAGTYTIQLRLRANQGTGTAGRMFVRVTIVQGSSGTWSTQANLLTTAVTGGSPSAGQTGWRAQQDASRITVTSTAANFTGAIATSGESTGFTFGANDRILVEFGFGDGDSATDRTWRLDYNQGSSFIDIPDLVDPISAAIAGSSTFSGTLTAGNSQISAAIAGTSTFAGALTGKGAIAAVINGTSTFAGTLLGKKFASAAIAGTSTFSGTLTGDGTLTTVIAGTSTCSGTLTAAGGPSPISALIAGTSTLTGTLHDATPPIPPPPPAPSGGGGGGGGGGGYWHVRRSEIKQDSEQVFFERLVDRLEELSEKKDPQIVRRERTGKFIGGAAALLFTMLLGRKSDSKDDT
jgi:hypothetical protein